MKPRPPLILAVILVLAGLTSLRAGEAAGEPADTAAIQTVISDQIAAFQAGDGERAYGHAAPAIKRLFPSVAIFMRMVEQGYEPVFRPRSFAFIDLKVGGDDAVQYVDLVGPDGAAWIAMYTLRRQPDGSWKITGCRLKPATGV